MDSHENIIEWLTGDDVVRVTFTQQKYINRIERMSKTHGECAKILHKNKDGSIYAEIPLSAVHLTIYGRKTGGFAVSDKELM